MTGESGSNPGPDPAGGVLGVTDWYRDETSLLGEVKRAVGGSAALLPDIAGYDDLVELRRGGQGVVFAATQRSTKRRVAIKVLLEGSLSSPLARRRFEREIDLVAALRHPGIVRVYDSGVTAGGHPFCVMEFIEGAPLDEWTRGRDPRAVVTLMRDVARAVHFAHQRGVIHRDLKPSNIRVDPAGQPHVLDFGLAKAIGAEGQAQTQVSTTGQFVGSLPWASPEQARGEPDGVDLRTDVYSMGVMLYQGLTGHAPYDVSGGLSAALRTIQEAQPPPPRRHARWMDEDLSTIVTRSLAKEASRRYQSAGDLADDLERWLTGEPIAARADSTWYQVRKAIVRHKAASASAAVALGMLVVFGVVMTVMYGRTLQERDRATAELRRRQAVAQVLDRMLTSVDAGRDGREVRVIQVLDSTAAQLASAPPEDREVEATVRESVARAYRALGQYARSVEQWQAAGAAWTALRGERAREVLRARVEALPMLPLLGRFDEAQKEADDLLKLAAGALGPGDALTLEARAYAGQLLLYRGRYDESIAMLSEAAAGQRELAAREASVGPELASTLSDLGLALRRTGRLKEAREAYSESGRLTESAGKPRVLEALQLRNNVALIDADLGASTQAMNDLERVVADAKRDLGPTHPQTVAFESNLATVYLDLDRFADAQAVLREALAAESAGGGPETPSALTIRNNLAKAVQDGGDVAGAVTLFREVLDLRRRVLGAEHEHTLVTQSNLASALASLKKYDEALALQRETLAIRERTGKVGDLSTLIALNNIARTLESMEKFDEATAFNQRCVDEGAKSLPPGSVALAKFRGNLARLMKRAGRLDQAAAEYRLALDAGSAALGDADAWVQQILKGLAEVLERQGKADELAVVKARLKPDAAPPPAR